MREFNTSGPNIPAEHYTIIRTGLIKQGIKLVEKAKYFTIWAPRQTGKSTYFRQLAESLKKQDYKVAYINFENYRN
jgi:predicted AAA+ superfamily ATPase